MSGRKSNWAKALLAALGAGLLLFSLPVGLVETVVGGGGRSPPQTPPPPPPGRRAPRRVGGGWGGLVLGLAWAGQRERRVALLTHDKQGRESGAAGVSEMGFALSKLNWLSRGRSKTGPALRRSDSHPDAPARAPIFASRDFGGLDIFTRTAPTAGEEEAQAAPSGGLAISGAPEKMTEETAFARLQQAFSPENSAETGPETGPEAVDADPAEMARPARARPAPIAHLSLAELTQRLEQGLAQRKRMGRPVSVLADMPVETAVPVRDEVEQGVDEALRAALGTLRTMTGRAR